MSLIYRDTHLYNGHGQHWAGIRSLAIDVRVSIFPEIEKIIIINIQMCVLVITNDQKKLSQYWNN